MGVDYCANFGIGYRIQEPNWDEEEFSDIDEYISSINENSEFMYFTTGDELSNRNIEYYIVYHDDINENTDLKAIKLKLDNLIDKNKITIDSNFGLVGGLLIW